MSFYTEKKVDISTIELNEEDFNLVKARMEGKEGSDFLSPSPQEVAAVEGDENVFLTPSPTKEPETSNNNRDEDFIFPSPPQEADELEKETSEVVPVKEVTNNQIINIEVEVTAMPVSLHKDTNQATENGDDDEAFVPPSPPDETEVMKDKVGDGDATDLPYIDTCTSSDKNGDQDEGDETNSFIDPGLCVDILLFISNNIGTSPVITISVWVV